MLYRRVLFFEQLSPFRQQCTATCLDLQLEMADVTCPPLAAVVRLAVSRRQKNSISIAFALFSLAGIQQVLLPSCHTCTAEQKHSSTHVHPDALKIILEGRQGAQSCPRDQRAITAARLEAATIRKLKASWTMHMLYEAPFTQQACIRGSCEFTPTNSILWSAAETHNPTPASHCQRSKLSTSRAKAVSRRTLLA